MSSPVHKPDAGRGRAAGGRGPRAERLPRLRAGGDAALVAEGKDNKGVSVSYVPDMWRRIHPPDILVYLDASYETVTARRPGSLMNPRLYEQMLQQVKHAREHADLIIATDAKDEEGVFVEAASYLTLLRP